MKYKLNRLPVLLAALAGTFSLWQGAEAANTPVFTFTSRDMMLCLRKTGAVDTTSAYDLQIDIGQVSLYYGATPGSTNVVANFSGTLFSNVFDSLNGVSWSVAAIVPTVGDSGDPTYLPDCMWLTAPRLNPATQAVPAWVRNSASTQGTTVAQAKSVLEQTYFYSSTQPANATSNTSSTVVVPISTGLAYDKYVGPLGNYTNTFQGNVENTTPADFTTAGQPARSDFYQLQPDGTATQPFGKYLGYFELSTSGTLSFVASPPQPTILNIIATNNVQSLSFLTVNGPTYTLVYTNSAGLTTPTSTWAVGAAVTGNGLIMSLPDSSTDSNRFYRVWAH